MGPYLEKVFVDVIKDLKIRSSCITRVSPKSSDGLRNAQRRDTGRKEDQVKTEAEIGVMLPQAKERQKPQKLEKAWKDSPPEPLEDCIPANTLILYFWSSEP